MAERSLLLFNKIVVLLILFPPYHQLGSEFKFQTAAQQLPEDEVLALKKIVSSLELVPEPIINASACDENQFHSSIIIGCDTSDTDGRRHITNITMEDARLTGEIPADVANLTYLQTLNLSNNKLHGAIPNMLGNLPNLIILDLSQNQLTGQIPLILGNLTSLQKLYLGQNLLGGEVPSTLTNLASLVTLGVVLEDNELSGDLPRELGNLSNLQEFSVAGNNLSGPIPQSIGMMVNLAKLNLIGNNFEGELPPQIFHMQNLQYLAIVGLKGPARTFPKSANLSSIHTLILRNCNITGEIPPYISNRPNTSLKNLDLSFNNLVGGVSDDFKNQNLDSLFLTGNSLSGYFPTWVYKTVKHQWNLWYNNFTFLDEPQKTFPQQIMHEQCGRGKPKYHSLFINAGGEEITLGRDRYEADDSQSNFYVSPAYNWAYTCSGNSTIGLSVDNKEASLYSKARSCSQSLIYYGFCLLDGPYTVALHFAEDLSSPGKRVFDVYIQGTLMLKDFNIKEKEKKQGKDKILRENFTVSIYDHLLIIELFWDGKGSISVPHSLNGPLISALEVTPNFKVGGGLSKTEIAGIVLAAVLAPLVLLALMWRMGWLGDRELRVTYVELRGKSYCLKEIIDATGNFSSSIGTGRFGTVYKADLGDQIVAVKKLSAQARHVTDQIGTELYVQGKPLKHDNLVQLLGCCSKKNLHLLFYEHMENRSLQQALFDQDSKVQLDWPKRFRICQGIAKGLKYLHEDNPNRKIIHRNIKPSNILLDESLNAKVADLGLAKIYEEEDPYSFIRENGTTEYMAPEYPKRLAITDKVDVYSFGIVLLEIVSGEPNVKYEENRETVFLLDKAIELQKKGKIMDLVDKNLSGYTWHQANKILELAMQCIDQSPTARPAMSHIISVLEQRPEVEQSALA